MKLIIFISIFCITLATCMAAISRGVFKDPNHPGKCVVDGLVISPGKDAQNPNNCGKIFCYENSEVEIHSCGAVAPPPGFKLGKPTNAPYPDCCQPNFIKA